MIWESSSGRIALNITRKQAASVAHPGPCDLDVAALLRVPHIARQVTELNPALVALELREYGAWSTDELANHADNSPRLVWIAGCDIAEKP